MNFLETGLLRDGRRCMFMKRSVMTREFQLFLDIDLLIAENYSNESIDFFLVLILS